MPIRTVFVNPVTIITQSYNYLCTAYIIKLSTLSMQHSIYLNIPTTDFPIYSISSCHGHYKSLNVSLKLSTVLKSLEIRELLVELYEIGLVLYCLVSIQFQYYIAQKSKEENFDK